MKDARSPETGLHQFPQQKQDRRLSTFATNTAQRIKAEPKKLVTASAAGALAGAVIALGWMLVSKPRKLH